MDRSRVLVYAAVAVIVGTTLVSGPAIGLVDLTTPRYDTTGLGEGNVTVDRVDAPATATIERGFESESYRLEVPDARIHVASIRGKPVVAYRLSIPEMGYSRTTSHFLSPDDEGWVRLSLASDTFANESVTERQYAGTLSIVFRYNETEVTRYNESIPVEVTG